MLLFGFGTATMPAHHSVGSFTLVISPMLCIHSNLSLTFGINGSATCPRVIMAYGVLSSLSLILYSVVINPKPVNPRPQCLLLKLS